MNAKSESRFPDQDLTPGEKVIYQSPRNWSSLIEPMFGFLLAILLGFGYSQFSVWLYNIISIIRDIPISQPDIHIEQAQLHWSIALLALPMAAFF
jgi:hypothetical protein